MASSAQVKCLNAIQSEIKGLDLSGLDDDWVLKKKLPSDRGLDTRHPYVIVSLIDNAAEQNLVGTNISNDVGYPCLVTFVAAADQNNEINDDTDLWLYWREQVFLHFNYQVLDGVSEVIQCIVVPRPIIDLRYFVESNLFLGALQINCINRLAPV